MAIGWGAYLNELLDSVFGYELPKSLANPPGEDGGQFNLPAMFLVLAVSAVLMVGVRESARANTIMVFFKLAVLALFLVLGVTAFNADNFSPFFVEGEGFGGTVTAATLIFFAYIGFDAVSTSSEEVKEPKRDLPIAIIGSLGIATTLYILVAVVASGALPFDELKGQDAPLATALSEGAGFDWAANIISLGALVAITSVVLTLLYGQSRILFAMSRDGLMPKRVGKVNQRTRTPVFIIGICGVAFSFLAAVVPLSEIVKLVNIGTLFAFIVVNLGVIILRRTKPDMERGYRVPLVPWFPIIGILLCLYLAQDLELETWLRFIGWMLAGLVIYFLYGYRHSRLRQGEVVNPEAELPDALPAFPPASARARSPRECSEEGGRHVQVRRRRCADGARLLHAVARRGGRRAVDVQPARRSPLRHLGPARLRARHRGRPYPAMGFHTRGEMGGVWTPPIKLVDGIWFGVGNRWIGPATRFTSGYGHVRMRLPGQRRPEHRAHRLRARRGARRAGRPAPQGQGPAHGQAAHADALRADVDLPLGRDDPQPDDLQPGRPGRFAGRSLIFTETGDAARPTREAHDWAAAVGSSLRPKRARTGAAFRGPQGAVICPPSGPNTPPTARPPCDDTALRQGHGRRADLQGQAAALGPHHRVVRRRRLRVRRPRRPRRARAAARPPGRGAARQDPRARARCRATPSSTCRAIGCSRAASTGASRTSPTPCRSRATSSCATSTPARATRPRRPSSARRASSAPASPTTRGCSPPTASSPPSPPSRSASSSRSRSTCARCARRR